MCFPSESKKGCMFMSTNSKAQLQEIAQRIREMRQVCGLSEMTMAKKTDVTEAEYRAYEAGEADLPFTFIHKCAIAFGIAITDLLEGTSPKLSTYTITRKGHGQQTAKEDGISIQNLAPMFRKKLAEPYFVRYEYSEAQQHQPIHLTTHSGQEFDLVLEGSLKVQVGEHTEILREGDSIYYNSSTPHGMIAVDGKDCSFCAVVLPGENTPEAKVRESVKVASRTEDLICQKFIHTKEDENRLLKAITFTDDDKFNFAFDIVDEIANRTPNKLAMIHLDREKNERRFTFQDMKKASNRCANYFRSLGIQKGDRVMLVLKCHYQFWFAILALHKIGAIVVPATNLLKEHDLTYRFDAAGIKAIVCANISDIPDRVDAAQKQCPNMTTKILAGGKREGWHDFDAEYSMFSGVFERSADTPCGNDPMLMFFTSGTTGYPKIALHSFTYPLGHYITAKYWHTVEPDGLHFTISDTGWGKALWGKLYGQWMCEGAVFTYDFDRFDAADILPLFAKYQIKTFCAPPTMYRMMIKEDLTRYDFTSVRHATTAGEALNPEVFLQFEKATGLRLMEGYGQTETTLSLGNLIGGGHKIGSMGKAIPLYDIHLLSPDGEEVKDGESGEICIRTADGKPNGLFLGYYNDDEKTKEAWHDGYYHTGDVAWRDEDDFYWYVGRADDVIKSSGYRIGPFEIESVIMELPYVLECGVCAAPDEIRGQVVKACIVLTKGTEPSDELKREIQSYVKEKTAPYKYPRIVEFRTELPKTISGKIQRNKL